MLTQSKPVRATLLGLAGMALVLMGADDPETKQATVRGLSFEHPTAWEAVQPESSMRALQLNIEPAEGDEDPAELILFAFPGGAGGVQANIERWQQQFEGADGRPPEVETKTIKGKNVEVTYVEIAGRYVAPVQPGLPDRYDKPGHRLLGAIITTPQTSYFFRLVGPDKTVSANRSAFESMLETMEVGR